MAILNPDHLLEQAERLIEPTAGRAPRQADLRRAISAAYYALFHSVATALADEFVGKRYRTSARYALVYRSVDHRRLRDVAHDLAKSTPPAKLAPFIPANGMGSNFPSVVLQLAELQEKRHSADYDPFTRVNTSDAEAAILGARSAIRRFGLMSASRRKAFLTLLAFTPRQKD